MNNDQISVNEGYWWNKYKKSDIDVVYLTNEKEFAVVISSREDIPKLTISERDAIMLRDAGINFTDEALQQTELNENHNRLALESFHRWLEGD